ncbi:heterogeneous nuclear ribonucleoprotein A1-like 2 [Hypanus sabinus]|uniref:heterogeneous nuclear ribonucleoprotein A1-like 2 n=1 Tax=Hypanus sabinus TaxID=79690 RepID=UPI0028C49691|nr:heterogeneous nuclear ribonucleoprotein A1-like 2 [Hypanus sabinus]
MPQRPPGLIRYMVDVRRFVPKEDSNKPGFNIKVKKLFMVGIREYLNEGDLRSYFSDYGLIENVDVACDHNTVKKRGFASVHFQGYDSVDKAVIQRHHTIKASKLPQSSL